MPHIFVDLDGVLVDFEKGYEIHNGHRHDSVDEDTMWNNITNNISHWEQLPVMPGAMMLWAHIAHHAPTILTGCPSDGHEAAQRGKQIWCARELGAHVPVITTYSRLKPKFMKSPGDILIDDMAKNTAKWENAGGVAILHTSAEETIARLRELGL